MSSIVYTSITLVTQIYVQVNRFIAAILRKAIKTAQTPPSSIDGHRTIPYPLSLPPPPHSAVLPPRVDAAATSRISCTAPRTASNHSVESLHLARRQITALRTVLYRAVESLCLALRYTISLQHCTSLCVKLLQFTLCFIKSVSDIKALRHNTAPHQCVSLCPK